MDLYLYQADYIDDLQHDQENLFYYDIGYKCFDCNRFSRNGAYHCKICDIGCLDGEIYEHCEKCNRCHKISLNADYCRTCEKCVVHFNNRCVKCPLICDKCGDSQPFSGTLRHCQRCSACYYRDVFRHCSECKKCVNSTWSHCAQCNKCHSPDFKHCIGCEVLMACYSTHTYCEKCSRCFDNDHCISCHLDSRNHHGCKVCGCVEIYFNDRLSHCQDCNRCHGPNMKFCLDCQKCVSSNSRHISRLGKCLPELYYDEDGYKTSYYGPSY